MRDEDGKAATECERRYDPRLIGVPDLQRAALCSPMQIWLTGITSRSAQAPKESNADVVLILRLMRAGRNNKAPELLLSLLFLLLSRIITFTTSHSQ